MGEGQGLLVPSATIQNSLEAFEQDIRSISKFQNVFHINRFRYRLISAYRKLLEKHLNVHNVGKGLRFSLFLSLLD